MSAPAMADTDTPPGVFEDQAYNPGGFTGWWKPADPFLIAQPFTPVHSGRAFDMSIYISSTEPNPSAFTSAAIHAFPLDGEMSAEPIEGGEGTLSYSEEINNYDAYTATATFPGRPSLVQGVRYALVINPQGVDGDGQASFLTGLGDAYPHNAQTKESGSWEGHMTGRLFFQLRMVPELIPVTPPAPTYVAAEECGIAPVVQIPEKEGVVFSSTREGNVEQVTAEPAEGYVFPADAQTQWEFDVSVTPCPIDVTPLAPTFRPATCEAPHEILVPEVDGVVYTVDDGEGTVRVSAAAAEGYVLAEGAASSWEFDVTEPVCEVPGGDPTPDESAPAPEDGQLPETGVGSAPAGALTAAGLLVLSGAAILARRHRAAS